MDVLSARREGNFAESIYCYVSRKSTEDLQTVRLFSCTASLAPEFYPFENTPIYYINTITERFVCSDQSLFMCEARY